jgi:SNW domain-containing protein 1
VYSKPLFERGAAAGSVYRPKRDDADVYGDADTQMEKLKDTSRFQPDKGFQGTEGAPRGLPRTAPVQFEASSSSGRRGVERDNYGEEDVGSLKRSRR